MATKKYKVTVTGKSDAECDEKMQAIAELLPLLSGKEWKNMAYMAKYDQDTMNIVRPILNR